MEALFTGMGDWFAAMVLFMGVPAMVLFALMAGIGVVLLTFFYRVYIAYRMAVNRHREPIGWVLLSFCFSPILTWIILLIVGDDKR